MDSKCEFSQLKIPADHDYSDIAGKYAGSLASKYGLDDLSVEQIQISVDQVTSWIIDYSFEEYEKEYIEISCEIVPEGFKISIKDTGLPIDQHQIQKEISGTLNGILYLKKKYMDEIRFNNLGNEGKEIVLIKYTQDTRITEYYNTCELGFYDDEPSEQLPKINSSACTIRAMLPNEAIEVSKCIYKGYGYSYTNDHVYYPDKLVEYNKNNKLYSVVTVSDSNEIAGHSALHFKKPGDKIAEISLGVVKPAYRGHGYFNKMTEYLIETAKSKNLTGLYIHAVTNHPYSQKVGNRYGFHECAIILGYIPASVQFRGINKTLPQRISAVMAYKTLDNSKRPDDIYPPPHHQTLIRKLYKNMGIEQNFGTMPLKEASIEKSKSGLQIELISAMNFAGINISNYGKNCVKEIKKRLKELCLKKVEVINLHLDLSNPLTAYFTDKFEELGFFFAGVLPAGTTYGDVLILQYLNNVPISYEDIQVHSETAKHLLSYIKDHDPNLAF